MIGMQETQDRNASAPDLAEYCIARSAIVVAEAAATMVIGDVTRRPTNPDVTKKLSRNDSDN